MQPRSFHPRVPWLLALAVAILTPGSLGATEPPPHFQEIKFSNYTGSPVTILSAEFELATGDVREACTNIFVPAQVGPLPGVVMCRAGLCGIGTTWNARRITVHARTIVENEPRTVTVVIEAPSCIDDASGCEGYPGCLEWHAEHGQLDPREGFRLAGFMVANVPGQPTGRWAHLHGWHFVSDDPAHIVRVLREPFTP